MLYINYFFQSLANCLFVLFESSKRDSAEEKKNVNKQIEKKK